MYSEKSLDVTPCWLIQQTHVFKLTSFKTVKERVRLVDKTQLLKDLKKEAHQIQQKLDQIQDPKKKQRLMRKYAELISTVVDISEILS